MNLQVDVYNVSFNREGAILDCRVVSKRVNANMQIFAKVEETQEALANGTTGELAYKYIAELGCESGEVVEEQRLNMVREIESLKEQNKVLSEAVTEIGEMLAMGEE